MTAERGTNENPGEEDSDSGNTEHENTITYFASEYAQGDFFFGDGDSNLYNIPYYQQPLLDEEDWKLPREAFNIRYG